MLFSVIYSFDCEKDAKLKYLKYLKPPESQFRKKLWDCTEGDEEAEYSAFPHGKHRKYCAILDRKEFERFISHCGLFANNVETMGALGAPGCGLGISPAICFSDGKSGGWASSEAYVTPMPELLKKRKKNKVYTEFNKADFKRIKKAFLSLWS